MCTSLTAVLPASLFACSAIRLPVDPAKLQLFSAMFCCFAGVLNLLSHLLYYLRASSFNLACDLQLIKLKSHFCLYEHKYLRDYESLSYPITLNLNSVISLVILNFKFSS